MNSLEQRLQTGLALALIAIFSLFWMLGNHSIRGMTEEIIASRLEHDAEGILSALMLDRGPQRVRRNRIGEVYNQPFSGHYFVVQLADGSRFTSRSLWDYKLALPDAPVSGRALVAGPAGQQLLMIYRRYQKQRQSILLAVAEDMTSLQEQRLRFSRYFGFSALAGLVLLLFIQSIIVRRAVRRLEPIQDDMRQLALGEINSLSLDVPREVLPLVQEFNRLLNLMSQRLQRSRHSLGNLAHALKGPLNLLTQYLDEPVEERDAKRAADARVQAERIHHLMEREMKRARLVGEGMPASRFDPQVDLPDLLKVLGQVHRDRKLDLQLRIDKRVPAFGDREDMLELLGNLLDNACKWSKSTVLCSLSVNGNLEIDVEDDGIGLSDWQLQRLVERGVRLDEMMEGHGLGLAIVKDVVTLYGGKMQFERSLELGGLRVRVTLPRRATDIG